MKAVVINQYEKVGSDDINQLQLALFQALQDDTLYNYFGRSAQGCLGSGLKGSYVSALASSIAVGAGFYFDSTKTGFTPKFQQIVAASAISVTHTAADATHDRIDVVALSPNFAVTATASRFVKTGGTGPITAQTVNKYQADSYTLHVVAGTPASSPVAPSVPAGSIPIMQCYITAVSGMSGSGAVTDTRTVLTFPVSNSGHMVAIATTLQGQLDQLDAAAGGVVVAVNPGSTPTLALDSTYNGKILEVNSANGPLSITAPSAPGAGFKIIVKDVGGAVEANPITLTRNGSGNIEGLAADYVYTAPFGKYTMHYNGTAWWKE